MDKLLLRIASVRHKIINDINCQAGSQDREQ